MENSWLRDALAERSVLLLQRRQRGACAVQLRVRLSQVGWQLRSLL